jgi:hypothetical protein
MEMRNERYVMMNAESTKSVCLFSYFVQTEVSGK